MKSEHLLLLTILIILFVGNMAQRERERIIKATVIEIKHDLKELMEKQNETK